ncbi:NADH-quinone oxidoreductase subunit J [Blochmannia endosymbiont of Camponotus sp.]|uniref:NADH-quinone oxidoreductase subunit J n=1 Tax=Blochmannia endosymbiont of Camponotus sp. TaxID=700220 RepID=UPI00202446C3|nr:NADH-quinone oxidoreductase subunit J [Blochmannia endosymbiont of Camponotus sp.]URJ31190.1 NADH-quinone oxidoreductase subunit J [Blochmannia endosymbiont of Camponotus sp.]
MTALFYVSGIIAIISTMCVIVHYHPIHALLYLIVSFISMSCNFFSLGASFAGAVEIIIYAGAIMILFVFVIMMLNAKTITFREQKSRFLNPILGCGAVFLTGILLIILLYVSFGLKDCFININRSIIDSKQIGISLFGPYLLMVELASFLLLSALISVFHLARNHKLSDNCIVSDQSQE